MTLPSTASALDDEFPSLKHTILADRSFHLPSRLAWLMTDVSSASGLFHMRRETTRGALGATSREIDLALRTITEGRWRLFRWDERERAYRCNRVRGETSRAFKARVQRTVNVKLGVAWVLRDLLECRDGYSAQPAPHSCAEFAAQLGCHEKSVSRVMRGVLGSGCFRRYRRRGAPLYTRFNDRLASAYEAKYRADPLTEDAGGISRNVIPLFGDRRGNKSRSRGVTNLDSRGNKSRSRGNKSRRETPKNAMNDKELSAPIQLDRQLVSFGDEASSNTQPGASSAGRRETEIGRTRKGTRYPREVDYLRGGLGTRGLFDGIAPEEVECG